MWLKSLCGGFSGQAAGVGTWGEEAKCKERNSQLTFRRQSGGERPTPLFWASLPVRGSCPHLLKVVCQRGCRLFSFPMASQEWRLPFRGHCRAQFLHFLSPVRKGMRGKGGGRFGGAAKQWGAGRQQAWLAGAHSHHVNGHSARHPQDSLLRTCKTPH